MTEIANTESRTPVGRRDQSVATVTRKVLPAMDIWEDEGGVTLVADMPGVGKDDLSVEIAEHTLTLKGHIAFGLPEGLAARFAELRGSTYERQFTLGEGIDSTKIEATAKDGVVTVHLPKAAALRRRRIDVKAG